MAIATVSKILGLNDMMISELTADTGAALTYDTGVDIPGVTKLSLNPSYVEKELRGDEALLDTYQRLDAIEFSFEHVKVSLDVLEIITGGSLAASGNTPNQLQTLSITNAHLAKYFKLQGKVVYSDLSGGDMMLVLYKCKGQFKIEFQTEEYAVISCSGKAIGTTNNNKIFDLVFRETTAALS